MYVTMHIKKIGRRKSEHARLGLCKIVFALAYVLQFAVTLVKCSVSKTVHVRENSVLNMIRLLVSVFDWPIIMIRPDVLLLVAYVLQFAAEAGEMQCQ